MGQEYPISPADAILDRPDLRHITSPKSYLDETISISLDGIRAKCGFIPEISRDSNSSWQQRKFPVPRRDMNPGKDCLDL